MYYAHTVSGPLQPDKGPLLFGLHSSLSLWPGNVLPSPVLYACLLSCAHFSPVSCLPAQDGQCSWSAFLQKGRAAYSCSCFGRDVGRAGTGPGCVAHGPHSPAAPDSEPHGHWGEMRTAVGTGLWHPHLTLLLSLLKASSEIHPGLEAEPAEPGRTRNSWGSGRRGPCLCWTHAACWAPAPGG